MSVCGWLLWLLLLSAVVPCMQRRSAFFAASLRVPHRRISSLFRAGGRIPHAFSSSSVTPSPTDTQILRRLLHVDAHSNHTRFWLSSFEVSEPENMENTANGERKTSQLVALASELLQREQTDLPRSELGLVLIPRHGLIVPMHDGKIQPQHAHILADLITDGDSTTGINTHTNNTPSIITDAQQETITERVPTTSTPLKVLVCGFSPRAQMGPRVPLTEEERPVNATRLAALNAALKRMQSVTPEELTSAKYTGTPPARIYRSFVAPRANTQQMLESTDRAAQRVAQQIELALRQLRADEASFLRNNDQMVTSSRKQECVSHPLVLVLDNLRSANNVGSIFRTAETAGVEKIVTCGITPTPPNAKLRKTALGSQDVVPCEHFEDALQAVEALKARGYSIVVMETTSNAEIYTQTSYPPKTALVLGNEVTGVDPRIIERADKIVEIPMFGLKNSLNVAAAAPVVVFEVLRQWTQKTSN